MVIISLYFKTTKAISQSYYRAVGNGTFSALLTHLEKREQVNPKRISEWEPPYITSHKKLFSGKTPWWTHRSLIINYFKGITYSDQIGICLIEGKNTTHAAKTFHPSNDGKKIKNKLYYYILCNPSNGHLYYAEKIIEKFKCLKCHTKYIISHKCTPSRITYCSRYGKLYQNYLEPTRNPLKFNKSLVCYITFDFECVQRPTNDKLVPVIICFRFLCTSSTHDFNKFFNKREQREYYIAKAIVLNNLHQKAIELGFIATLHPIKREDYNYIHAPYPIEMYSYSYTCANISDNFNMCKNFIKLIDDTLHALTVDKRIKLNITLRQTSFNGARFDEIFLMKPRMFGRYSTRMKYFERNGMIMSANIRLVHEHDKEIIIQLQLHEIKRFLTFGSLDKLARSFKMPICKGSAPFGWLSLHYDDPVAYPPYMADVERDLTCYLMQPLTDIGNSDKQHVIAKITAHLKWAKETIKDMKYYNLLDITRRYCHDDVYLSQMLNIRFLRTINENTHKIFETKGDPYGCFSMSSFVYGLYLQYHQNMYEDIINHPQSELYDAVHNAYYGGRCECKFVGEVINYNKSTSKLTSDSKCPQYFINQNIVCIDATSLYPASLTPPLPHGIPRIITHTRTKELNEIIVKFGAELNCTNFPPVIALCHITPPKNRKYLFQMAPVPIRLVPENSEQTANHTTKLLAWTNAERTQMLATPHIFLLLSTYHKVRIIPFSLNIEYDKWKPSMREFLRVLYQLKEEGARTGDICLRTLAKNMMNSMYGRFALKPWSAQTAQVTTREKMIKFLKLKNQGKIRIQDIVTIGRTDLVKYQETNPKNKAPIQYAIYCTSWSHVNFFQMYRPLEQDQIGHTTPDERIPIALYADTDSIVMTKDNLSKCDPNKISEKLGFYDIDNNKTDITYKIETEKECSEALFVAKKCYCMGKIVKCKGHNIEDLNYQKMKECFDRPTHTTRKTFKKHLCHAPDKHNVFSIHISTLKRQLRPTKNIQMKHKNVKGYHIPIETIAHPTLNGWRLQQPRYGKRSQET